MDSYGQRLNILIVHSWCGFGSDYCAAPDCQFKYGPGCNANQVPAGASTAGITRPVLGSVPYGGVGIHDCTVAGGKSFRWGGPEI